jgi:hypothetical protein
MDAVLALRVFPIQERVGATQIKAREACKGHAGQRAVLPALYELPGKSRNSWR